MFGSETSSQERVFSLRKQAVVGSDWRLALPVLAAMWGAIIALFWDTVVSIVSVWSQSKTYEHGFLVLPIFLYLCWHFHRRIAVLHPRPNYWGLAFLAGMSLAWFLGRLMDIGVVQQFAVVAMLTGVVWAVLGTAVTRAVLFPLLFLFFAVPVGEEVIPVLQDYTAWFVVKALQASRVPVFWEGRLLTIPSGTWEVHESCSGIRYVFASLTFGYLYAGLTYRRWSRRIGFLVACAIVPVLGNGLRAYGIVMLAHLSGNSIAVGVDHFIYGWVFFGLVMGLLIIVGGRWRESSWQPELAGIRSPAGEQVRASVPATAVFSTALAGLAILAIAPLSVAAMQEQERTRASTVVRPVDLAVTHPWKSREAQSEDWQPRFFGATVETFRRYESDANAVDVYVAYYAREKSGSELINSLNDAVDRTNWTPLRAGTRRVRIDGTWLHVREVTVRSRVWNRMVWSWYWVDGQFTANPYYAKLLQLKAKITKGFAGGAAIVLAAPYSSTESEAIGTLTDFAEHWEKVGRTLSHFQASD